MGWWMELVEEDGFERLVVERVIPLPVWLLIEGAYVEVFEALNVLDPSISIGVFVWD